MPDWKQEIRRRLANLQLAPTREAAIVEELAQHLADCYAEWLASGATEAEAERQTRSELSSSELLACELRRAERRFAPEPIELGTNRRTNMIADLWQDLRYGARMLLKNPGFSAVIALTLALGIGANAALFSVVNGVLLNPLPYPQHERLVALNQRTPNAAAGSISYPNFLDWQKENQTFSAMAVSRGSSFALVGTGEAERVIGRRCTANLFSVLGVKPALGRDFAPGEDERGAAPVVMISAELWQRRFGAAPDTPGKSLTVDDRNYTIVGVLPASFTLYRGTDVYIPMGQWNNDGLQNRSAGMGLQGIGQLKPGVTLAQAQADLDGVMRRLAEAYPEANRGVGATVVPLKERLIGDVGPSLWMLLGAVGFVLLIACVNVSNLLLARATGRTREFAIRSALGASQSRLLRQSLTESVLLALAGGGLGLLLAALGTRAALDALPTGLPRADEIGLDARVLLFTAAVSLLTGVLAGLAPALKTRQWRLAETLKENGRGAGGGRHRAQGVLVAVEVAMALVLLIGAGLMIRTLSTLWNVDPGFRPDNVLTFGLSFSPSMRALSPEGKRAALRDLSDRLNSMPGVRAASFSLFASLMQNGSSSFFWLDGQPKPASTSEMHRTLLYGVEPGYLTVMGIPLKQGRFFTAQDETGTQGVVVIDEVFARQYFPNTNPIGKRINLMFPQGPSEIIGVVGHVKQWGLDTDDGHALRAQLYLQFRKLGWNSEADVVARVEGAAGTAAAHFEALRRVVQSQHKDNVIYEPQTMNEVIAETLARRRFAMILLNAFAVVALVLSSLGLYGVISYLVGQSAHELGVRLALGAQRRDVLLLVLSQGMKMTLGGVALGLLAALGLTRLLAQMLYGVSATDPVTFAGIAMLLVAVALAACFVPAWRATKVDPLVALRCD
ncbi:MAG: ABC transporter permease [Acidobacteria bacterium]|nr:ABC transporter permease [Acidobacteriota bacterium]